MTLAGFGLVLGVVLATGCTKFANFNDVVPDVSGLPPGAGAPAPPGPPPPAKAKRFSGADGGSVEGAASVAFRVRRVALGGPLARATATGGAFKVKGGVHVASD